MHGMWCDVVEQNIKNTRPGENTAVLQIGENIGPEESNNARRMFKQKCP